MSCVRLSTWSAFRSSASSSWNFLQRQLDLLAAHADHVPVDVHPYRARLKCGGRQLLDLVLAAQHGTDPRDKLAQGEGLGHIVIGAEFEPNHLVDLGVFGSQYNHRHIRPLPKGAAYLRAR